MAVRARSGLGRPPATGVWVKRNLTCYLSVGVIEGLDELAGREATTRNKLMARILTDYVARRLPAPALLATIDETCDGATDDAEDR